MGKDTINADEIKDNVALLREKLKHVVQTRQNQNPILKLDLSQSRCRRMQS